jgi:hypothetical protein
MLRARFSSQSKLASSLHCFFFVSKPKIYRFDGQEDRQYLPDIAALLTSGSSMASCD